MNKKMKKILLSALPALTVTTSFACLTSCSNTDMFHGNEAFFLDADGKQHWVSSLVKSNICPEDETKLIEDIIDNEGNHYKRLTFDYQIILNPSLKKIPDNFLTGCIAFNQGLQLNYTQITEIGDDFMFNCSSFNHKITFPPSVERIGDSFLRICSHFDSDIVLNSGLKWIGSYFMYGCLDFKKDIVIPESVEAIPNLFMNSCTNFDQTIYLPKKLKVIGSNFLKDCKKNFVIANLDECKELDAISSNFLDGCTEFNNDLDFSKTKIKAIGAIGNFFMRDCFNMSKPKENGKICFINLTNLPEKVFFESIVGLNYSFAMTGKKGQDIHIAGDPYSAVEKWDDEFTDEKGTTFYRSVVLHTN